MHLAMVKRTVITIPAAMLIVVLERTMLIIVVPPMPTIQLNKRLPTRLFLRKIQPRVLVTVTASYLWRFYQ